MKKLCALATGLALAFAGGSAAANNRSTKSSYFAADSVAPMVGTSTVYSPVTSNSKGYAQAYRFTATTNGQVDRLSVYVDGTNSASKLTVAIYDGSASSAATRRGQCVISNPQGQAWNRCSFPAYAIKAGTDYWLALLQPTGATGKMAYREGQVSGGPATYLDKASNLSSLPATWQNGFSWAGGYQASIYADQATLSAPPPTPTATPSPTATPTATPAAPAADFSISPEPAVRSKPTSFTSTGTCPAAPCTYQWWHGDPGSTDAIGTGPTTTYTYTGPAGERTVTLEVTDSRNRQATRTRSFQLVDSTPTPTPTSTPSPTPTATPGPAPTPTPGGSACPLPAYPDSSCTGVPAGTSLTTYTGPSEITTPNTVISGKRMGCIRVEAAGVVIRNSLISCKNPGTPVVSSIDGDFSGTPLLVEDSEVNCQNGPGTAFGDANVTVRRADIHGCENGFDVNQNITVEDSYIHDLYQSDTAHPDGIQMAAGHFVNGRLVAGSLNVTISHNTIYGMAFDGEYANAAIISNRGGDTNILIQDNLFAGGGYTIYCEQDAKGTNYRVLNNHFSTRFSPKVGFYGPSTDCSDETQSGNVYHETGKPLTLS